MSERKDPVKQLDQLSDRVLEELRATSDADILAGESPEAVRQRALARLQRARAVAGKDRLDDARIALSAEPGVKKAPVIPIETARERVRQALSDSRYTLAARQLEEMSDEDILAIYAQLVELEEKHDP